jgi:N-acetylmuramoyl-L-alanine amidase
VNLAIAARLKEALEGLGARVIMTRTSEAQTVSLADRVRIAEEAGADLLISVHNNALPDGRDPWQEHGTSSYWYHPQAIELARTVKASLTQALGFPDFGTLYQNLALTRPSRMPAVLVEVGFMINPDEYSKLIDPGVQQRAADAIAHGIHTYVSGRR